MSFEAYTVIIVLIIFSVFYYYAGKAEKVVDAKARAARQAQRNIEKPKVQSTMKESKKINRNKRRGTM